MLDTCDKISNIKMIHKFIFLNGVKFLSVRSKGQKMHFTIAKKKSKILSFDKKHPPVGLNNTFVD